MTQNGQNGKSDGTHRGLLERLTAIRIHAGIIRRAARRPGPLDKEAVVEQIDLIDRQAVQAAQLLAEQSPGAS